LLTVLMLGPSRLIVLTNSAIWAFEFAGLRPLIDIERTKLCLYTQYAFCYLRLCEHEESLSLCDFA
jgi:hypothetical protein